MCRNIWFWNKRETKTIRLTSYRWSCCIVTCSRPRIFRSCSGRRRPHLRECRMFPDRRDYSRTPSECHTVLQCAQQSTTIYAIRRQFFVGTEKHAYVVSYDRRSLPRSLFHEPALVSAIEHSQLLDHGCGTAFRPSYNSPTLPFISSARR